jgi:hypothetical protein
VTDKPEYIDLITGKPLEPWAQQIMDLRMTNPSPSPELKLCPFCGGEATYQWHSSPECWIECQTCFAVGPNDKDTTTEQHVAAWNTRAALSQTPPTQSLSTDVQSAATGFHEPDVSLKVAMPVVGEVERLRAALEPFAKLAAYIGKKNGTVVAYNDDKVTCEDFRNAAVALATVAAGDDEGVADDAAVIAEFAFLYRQYGLEDDAKLAPDALELKRKVLDALATSRSQHEGAE